MTEPLLERSTWDFIVDVNGDLAMCEEPFAIAQQVANEILHIKGEGWYDTTQGIPYDPTVLSATPSMSVIRSLMEAAALSVSGVIRANAVLYVKRDTRTLSGAVLVTTDSGVDLNVTI